MKPMTIQDIRKRNLQAVLEADFRGVKADLARAIGVSPNNISRYFSNTKDGRTVSDDTARKVEKATGKPVGWMDSLHQETTDPELDALMEQARREDPETLKAVLLAYLQGRRGRNP